MDQGLYQQADNPDETERWEKGKNEPSNQGNDDPGVTKKWEEGKQRTAEEEGNES